MSCLPNWLATIRPETEQRLLSTVYRTSKLPNAPPPRKTNERPQTVRTGRVAQARGAGLSTGSHVGSRALVFFKGAVFDFSVSPNSANFFLRPACRCESDPSLLFRSATNCSTASPADEKRVSSPPDFDACSRVSLAFFYRSTR